MLDSMAIIFTQKMNLIYIAICKKGTPHTFISKQLEYLHLQLTSLLTSFANNQLTKMPNYNIRALINGNSLNR
jgi:hypothetical protein